MSQCQQSKNIAIIVERL